jgi:hypothetical protein
LAAATGLLKHTGREWSYPVGRALVFQIFPLRALPQRFSKIEQIRELSWCCTRNTVMKFRVLNKAATNMQDYMKFKLHLLPVVILLLSCMAFNSDRPRNGGSAALRYIEVSRDNPAYFSFSDGSPYIPVGINMINPSGINQANPEAAFKEIEEWMKSLAGNGGNYIRVWLSNEFWDIEDVAGKYSEEKAKRIDRFVAMARKYHLRIKLTFEHFRSITMEENPQRWAAKTAYHVSKGGPFDSVRQYLSSATGQKLFLDKVAFYNKRYGNDTLFFGLELWNEMNAMSVPKDSLFLAWNKNMLTAVKQQFPNNLVMQSLGSFDGDYVRPLYKKMMALPGNEVAQVHRYLDPGAQFELCHGPMDLVCASAIQELLSYQNNKPVILAETGAVEARHAGPSRYYQKDTAGILLHDILFAPFFSGAAGPGMSWHWESYVHKNNLWYHYGRFNQAIKGIDPIQEAFTPARWENNAVRAYLLKGKTTSLLWLRDKASSWESELENGIPPQSLHGIRLSAKDLGISALPDAVNVYDPWKNVWVTVKKQGGNYTLPDFKRSIVVKVTNE